MALLRDDWEDLSTGLDARTRRQEAAQLIAGALALLSAPPSTETSTPAADHRPMTVAEVAAYLQVTEGYVCEKIRRKELKAANIGSPTKPRYRVECADLDAWLGTKALDATIRVTYSSARDDRRGAAAYPTTIGAYPGAVGRPRRRRPKLHRPARAGRNRDTGATGSAGPADGEGSAQAS